MCGFVAVLQDSPVFERDKRKQLREASLIEDLTAPVSGRSAT